MVVNEGNICLKGDNILESVFAMSRSSSNEALNSQKAEASTAPTPIQVTHHGHHHGHGPTVVHQQVQQQAMDTGNGGDDGGMGRGMNQDNVSRSRPR